MFPINKIQRALTVVFAAVFSLSFGYLFWVCLANACLFVPLRSAGVAGLCCLFAGAGILATAISRRWRLVNRRWFLTVAALLLFAVYFLLQLSFAKSLAWDNRSSWDFGIVANAAMQAARTGHVSEAYFRMWPNNLPLLVTLCSVFRLALFFGIHNLNLVGVGINIFSIDLALALTLLVVKKAVGSRFAGFAALVLMMATPAVLSYVTIYYTDTLTLPFPIGILYLWLCAKEKLRQNALKPAAFFCFGMGGFAAFGSLLKITVSFMLIAVLIDALLTFGARAFLRCAACAGIVFFCIFFALSRANETAPFLAPDPEDPYTQADPAGYYIPKLHWVMMGLRGNGGYCDEDYQLTLSCPGDERDELVRTEILRRLKNYGAAGLFEHLHQKCVYVFSDGSYYSAEKINRNRLHPSGLDAYLLPTGERFALCAYYMQALLALNFLCAVLAGFLLLRKKAVSPVLLPASISLFGLFLFQCLWEARSRYLFNYLPVFVAITVAVLFSAAYALPGAKADFPTQKP